MPFPWYSVYNGGATGGDIWTSSQTAATTSSLYTTSNTLFSILGNSGTQTATTTTGTVWDANTSTWTTVDPQTLWAQQADQYQQMGLLPKVRAQQAAYERHNFQIARIGGRELFRPAAPAIITHEQRLAEDRALYALAVAAHDEQEATRLQRQIEQLELANIERRRMVEERAQLAREEHARHDAARSRAQELLIEHLTPAQRESFKALGWFVVQGGKSGTKYRITSRGVAGNIEVLAKGGGDHDRATHRLCCHATDGGIPNADQWLAQKIMLELAEDDFLRKANRHAA